MESIAPLHFPGGGGFSIIQFTLKGLYDEFIAGRNWWTKSNCTLPLIRYLGCNLKLYRAEKYDYVVVIHRCYPLKASDHLYMSTQPSIQMMQRKSILVPCRQNSNSKKPYKRVHIKPPTQFETGWHFQQDLCNFPLVVITASVASFDRYYTASDSKSTTVGFYSLNTQTFQLHDWQDPPTTGYKPQDKLWLWGTLNGADPPDNTLVKHLIYLGGTGPYTKGVNVGNNSNYASQPQNWGNIFHNDYLFGTSAIFASNRTVQECVSYILQHQGDTDSDKVKAAGSYWTVRTIPNIVECRYNPFNDKSTGNKTYMVSNHSDHTAWHPIDNDKLQRNDLPLWLETWGWMDWMKKAQLISQPELNYVTVIQTKFISSYPKLTYYVPIDNNMELGQSPYIGSLTASDRQHWYPKGTFQIQTLNLLGMTGPGTVKMQKNQACEGHMEYRFKFKLGGCPAQMEKICDPAEQPKYPIPNIKQTTPSLQDPTTNFRTFLYDFDERDGHLTKRAVKRIKKDSESEQTILDITGPMDLPAPHQKTSTWDTETSEEEEEEGLQFELLKLRRKQHLLRQRIKNLLQQQNLE